MQSDTAGIDGQRVRRRDGHRWREYDIPMRDMNRRDLLAALSAFAALPTTAVLAQAAAGTSQGVHGEAGLLQSRTYTFGELPVTKSANGESRPVVKGMLPTGEAVEMHETTLLPGHMPHAPHKHRHSEFMMVREGTLEFDNDGTLERVGAGGVIFAASNIMHGVRNVGTVPANYFVIAIGLETGVQPV